MSGEPATNPPPAELKAEQIRALYNKALIPFVTVLINSAIVAVAVRNAVSRPIVLAWIAVLWALTLIRAGLVWAFRRASPSAEETGRWGWRFSVGAGVSGIVWGSAGLVLFVPDAIHLQVFLAFVLGGMAAGAATSHSSYPPAHLAFTFPALFPITLQMFRQGDEIHILMGILMCLFALAVSVIARTGGAMFEASTAHEIQNRALLELLQKRSELAEVRFRALIDQASLGIVVADANSRVIVDANRTVAAFLGMSAESLIGRSIDDLRLGEGPDVGFSLPEAIAAAENTETALVEIRHNSMQLEASLSLLMHNDQRYLLAVIKDVSERRALQSEQIRSESLASIGSLASGVAHEINNPLACIAANVQSVKEGLSRGADTSDAAHLDALDDTLASAHQIQQTVRSLMALDWSAPSATESVDLSKVIRSAARIASNQIRHSASFVVEIGDVQPVLGDTTRLSQLFLSLLTNAAQAVEDDSKPDQKIIVRAEQKDHTVRVDVTDTGAGIAPEVLPRIFEPFFTTKPVGKGTGLGLSLCHSIVMSVGGALHVRSKLGSGTTFTVELRVADPTVSPSSAGRSHTKYDSSEARARILVIDDDVQLGRAIRRLLAPHNLTIVSEGREALRLFEGGDQFDVVLCDVMMPELSGPELYERVRGTWPSLAERFVFVTGGVMSDDARSFLESTQNRRLAKPFSREELERVVRGVVEVATQRTQGTSTVAAT